MNPTMRAVATASAITMLLVGVPISTAPAFAAAEKPTAFNQFFFDLFGAHDAPASNAKRRHYRKAVRHVAPAKPAVAKAPKIDAALLREAVKDSIAEDPAVLRDVIADFFRNDPDLRKQLTASAPKNEPVPATPPAAVPAAVPAQKSVTIETAAIEKIVHDYIVAHPEVLQEAMAELEKRSAAAESEKHQAAVKNNAKELFSSPNQVTLGNPKGNVTLVEFFDYNCGYCKHAMADMLTLLKDPKLKVVLKEFPVLGPGSVEAAQVAVAVNMQDPTGKKYLEFHQKLLGSRGQANKATAMAVAKDVGLDMTRLEKDMNGPEVKVTLTENFKLAQDLGMNGTPSYVIGDAVVVGAVGLDALRERVNTARCGKASC